MARINLTAGRIRDFATDKAQAFLWDSDTPGLAVRATAPGKRNPGGGKAFIFQSKLASGQDVRITIGDVRSWGIDEAREQARTLQKLIDRGIDPRQEKQERVAAADTKREDARRQEAAVKDAWAAYIEARRHKWSTRHLLDHENLARPGGEKRKRGEGNIDAGPLAALMPLKLSDLTPEQMAEWLKKETATRPTSTALAYRLLRAFVRWCATTPAYQAVTHLEAVGARVAKDHVPKARAKEADCLQREQLPSWFQEVLKLSPVQSAYLQGLLITGARREELAGMEWDGVDFKWQSMTIRDKVEGERVIPLTPYLSSLLADLKSRNDTPPPKYRILNGKKIENDLKDWKPSKWVFASPTAEGGRIQEPRAAHNRALVAGGLPHLSLHGLRRSFGTLAEWVECPTGVVAQIQGHKPSAIAEKHYRRRPLDLLRMWHTRIEAWILKEAGIEQFKATTKKPGEVKIERVA